MKTVIARAILGFSIMAVLAGCDYDVKLVDTPNVPVNKALAGSWELATENPTDIDRMDITLLSENEYKIVWHMDAEKSLHARACICNSADLKLIQITWLGAEPDFTMGDMHVYQYAAYDLDGDKLTIRMLNADVVNKKAKTPAELLAAIKANKENPKLFREELSYKRK